MVITQKLIKLLPIVDSEIEKLLNSKKKTITSFQNTLDSILEMLKDQPPDGMEKLKISTYV